jgi:uncharacterized protein (DUF1778 family)
VAKKANAAADRPSVLRLTAPEYQLVAYAASKTKARGLNAFMREAVVEAARHAAGKEMADDILSGRGTVRLLKASLAEARAASSPGAAPTKPSNPSKPTKPTKKTKKKAKPTAR